MGTRTKRILAFSLTVAMLLILGNTNFAHRTYRTDEPEMTNRLEAWKQVTKAGQDRLPKTQISLLEQIYQSAIAEGENSRQSSALDAEAIRALCQKIIVESQLNQPAPAFAIRKLDKALESMPPRLRPMAEAILANWFEAYFQANRWRFKQRSKTTTVDASDFETWDLATILDEIDRRFQNALGAADALKKIPVKDYEMLLKSGDISDQHRPTVYDMLAHQAIGFYSLDEQIVRRQDAFTMAADGGVFASADTFVKSDFASEDSNSFLLKALHLYQSLLKFHQEDEDRTAFLDANLNRIQFANRMATGDEKKALYRSALQRFADQNLKHELSAKALAYRATSYHGDGDFVKAHQIATVGQKRFATSVGGAMCGNLISTIEKQELTIATENVWNAAQPEFRIRYRNLEKVYFRIVKIDPDEASRPYVGDPQNMDQKTRDKYFKRPPLKQWAVDLEPTDDFQATTATAAAPLDLESGSYLLLASQQESFPETEAFLLASQFWRSDLAHISLTDYQKMAIEGRVYDAISGTPVNGARVTLKGWQNANRNNAVPSKQAETITDEEGFYSVAVDSKVRIHHVMIEHEDQQLGQTEQSYRSNRGKRRDQNNAIRFFTDRSIYRPGQTIHFKGICVFSDRDQQNYVVRPNEKVTVQFRDANNQAVESLDLVSNEFGSVTGSFTAPRGATGAMSIFSQGKFRGQSRIRVEEYKRPKFRVMLEKPDQSFSLNETAKLTGTATAYNGAAIDRAKVVYRVVRSVRYPSWWYRRCWWMPPNNGSAEEIANGEMETAADGTFEISFPAKPDESVDRSGEPVFTYQIYADVTDSNGETRSDNARVRIGYTSLQANLTHEKWLTTESPVVMKVATSTLDSVPQAAKGKLKIYALKQPDSIVRQSLSRLAPHQYGRNVRGRTQQKPEADLSNFTQWSLGELKAEQNVNVADTGKAEVDFKLPMGAYRAVFETSDPAGASVNAEATFLVIDPTAEKFAIRIADHFAVESASVQPGETFKAVWATGYETGKALVEVYHRSEKVKSFWSDANTTMQSIEIPIEEKHRGGLHVLITFVRENRMYSHRQFIDVPFENKNLTVKWEHFVSKLQPGGRETWTAVVSGPDAAVSAIEMMASMYDSSLDQFTPHQWSKQLGTFYRDRLGVNLRFANSAEHLRLWRAPRISGNRYVPNRYRVLTPEVSLFGRHRGRGNYGMLGGVGGGVGAAARFGGAPESLMAAAPAMASPMGRMAKSAEADEVAPQTVAQDKSDSDDGSADGANGTEGAQPIAIRKNLQETAFFYPAMTTDAEGRVRIEFEIPEALTTWKFIGLAHDKELRTGLLTDEMTTNKDLMVQPNPPRFLREDDEIYFPVKVINQSDQAQSGVVELTLKDAIQDTDVDQLFSNGDSSQSFTLGPKESKSILFPLKVPDFVGALTWRATASTEKLSDGEEGLLPVLSRRILVTESLPLPIRGNQSRDFSFDAMDKIARSESLRSQSLTVQMTSNPSWYAVMALPYLMEYQHECSEQTFNRMYASLLGRRIVTSNPRIKTVFDQWRGTDALKSPLEKNEDLRNVMIAESPWLAEGQNESTARRNVGLLFDENNLNQRIERAAKRLQEMQLPDGAWPWFSEGRANEFLTLYITTGYGRLRKLGVDVDVQPAVRALVRLDQWIKQRHDRIIERGDLEKENLDSTIAMYLYGRTFFLKDQAVSDQYRPAFDYFVTRAKQHWNTLSSRQSHAHLAIALNRLGDQQTPQAIMKSLTERAINDDEMGRYWREGDRNWFWYRAPIETQAMLMEAYDEVLNDTNSVEECKIWLLKQKQTQAWKTTKSTADAVYALLLRGTDSLTSTRLVDVTIGGQTIEPGKVEAGTGFFEQRFSGSDIKQDLKQIRVAKSDDGIAWGSVHWQYLEDVSKIEPYEGTPLTLKKSLFIKTNTADGPVISPITGAVNVGDELVTRVEIRVDRDMEFVHLKDYRGSGTEPVNVLSRYKFQDGLWYYESTRDTASHFFIDYLPRGTYVFEYSTRVQLKGKYQTGIATLQSMYAPEFNSHSNSVAIEVR